MMIKKPDIKLSDIQQTLYTARFLLPEFIIGLLLGIIVGDKLL